MKESLVKKKNIITKGILKNFIHNLQTAHIFQTEAKGNYFNNDNCMTNCYLQKGTKTLKEIIAPIKNGIYINFLIGLDTGGINMINGDFNLEASGFKIINGEIKYPTEMFIIKGNFLDILKNIKDIASDDFAFQNDVGFGSASVYVGDIFINGE